MMDEGFFGEVTFKLRAEDVSLWMSGRGALQGEVNAEGNFFFWGRNEPEVQKKTNITIMEGENLLRDPGRLNCLSLSISVKWV